MFQSRPGRGSACALPTAPSAMILLLALASGGCSANPQAHQSHWAAGVDPAYRVAAEAVRRPDMEEDGMEAQVPPPPSIRMAPDDPSEPFSPNYGTRPVGAPAHAPAAAPAHPGARPQLPPGPRPAPRSKLASVADE